MASHTSLQRLDLAPLADLTGELSVRFHNQELKRDKYMSFVLPPDLTGTQAAIWLDQQLFSGRPIYNTGQALTIRGPLRIDLFEIALRETIGESPSLRLSRGPGPIS